jgi:methionyl-tRNA formyltransferase
MRVIFIGSVQLSEIMLESVIAKEVLDVVGVCTLREGHSNSDHVDLTPLCIRLKIPVRYTPEINAPESLEWIRSLNPDVIFCFGWSRLIREPLLSIARLGVIGFHPTLLPANRGRHPIIWALTLGLERTGSTFFLMNSGVDSGPIISQREIQIVESDDAGTLYGRIAKTAASQIDELVQGISTDGPIGSPQDEALASYWRKRTANDGLIDWRMSATGIRNLVRALRPPYMGAHFVHSEKSFTVWACKESNICAPTSEPGKVLKLNDWGIVVKCGVGSVLLTHVEPFPEVDEGDYL